MKIAEMRAWGKSQIDGREADLLLMEIYGLTKTEILTAADREEKDWNWGCFKDAVSRRVLGEPLQYILGRWEFMGLKFEVTSDVLIPREDTEILVNAVLSGEKTGAKGLEIGLGSGCVSVSLTHHGGLQMTGVDICPKALEVARNNMWDNCGINAQKTFIISDLFNGLTPQKFDFIVSNPPYIPTKDIDGLDISVKEYEPTKALDGGADGLGFYDRIIKEAPHWLVEGGRIYFEIGYDQGEEVKNILQEVGFSNVTIIKDLSDHDRVVTATA
ncbi:MAG: peptide chain release factor N(5)-glutamine methyltransferase [Defluviitaleaceae bacterium]|nr:peptide chain release factor N(5)-glutamine methyltransferase [Defluviitaleaceae bacterium]